MSRRRRGNLQPPGLRKADGWRLIRFARNDELGVPDMTALIALFWRDLRRAWGSGALWLPVVFFLLVATAFPFAVGPDAPLLARTGGGMVWVAALLAALLPIDRLVRPDRTEARRVGKEGVRPCRSRW